VHGVDGVLYCGGVVCGAVARGSGEIDSLGVVWPRRDDQTDAETVALIKRRAQERVAIAYGA
jgi:hypothetical protein